MDFESDEMFKLLKVQMTNWSKAAKIAQVAAAQAQPGAAANGGPAAAGLATKNKGGKKRCQATCPRSGCRGGEKGGSICP